MKVIKAIFELLRATYNEWNEDKAPQLAAALAYYIAFSLAPLLVLTIAIAGFILREQFVREEVLAQVSGAVGAQAADLVGDLMDSLRQPTSGIISTILGIGALIFGAINVFEQLKSALNIVWDVDEESIPKGAKGFILSKLVSFGMILAIGLLLLVSLIASTMLNAFDTYLASLLPNMPLLLRVLNTVISLGVIVLLFALIYRFLPDIRLEWRDVWIGALVTGVLFTIGKSVLGWYLGNSATASSYGAAGSFVLILLWINYSAQIVLFGAEFTQVFARRYGSFRTQAS